MTRAIVGLSILVALGALADLWVAVRGGRSAVPVEVMKKAADRIDALKKPGDLLVHSPLLSVAELAALQDRPVRPDRPKAILRSRRRVLVLDFADRPMFGLGTPAAEESIGAGLVLRTYPPTGAASGALWTLAAAITPSTMAVQRGAQVRPCEVPRAEGGFRCAGEPDWLYASVRGLRVGQKERECVWAHPTTSGTIIFNVPPSPDPAPGHRLELRVQAGLTDDAVRNTPDGAEVITEATQGGQSLGKVTVPNRVGWFRQSFELKPHQPAQLRITTVRDGRRHHCVAAQVVEVQG